MRMLLMQISEDIENRNEKIIEDTTDDDRKLILEEQILCNHFREIPSYNKKKLSLKTKSSANFHREVRNAVSKSKNSEIEAPNSTLKEADNSFQKKNRLIVDSDCKTDIELDNRQSALVIDKSVNHLNRPRKFLGIRHRISHEASSIKSNKENQSASQAIIGLSENGLLGTKSNEQIGLVNDSNTKVNNFNRLSLSIQTLSAKNSYNEKSTTSKSSTIIECANRKRSFNSSEDVRQSAIFLDNKRKKTAIMSVYDTRMQADDRSVSNGYITRGHNNDDNSPILGNHYCHNSHPMIATLCNIGNTCYLNSVVYTLRFAPLFLHNLHHLIEDLSHFNQKLGKRIKSSSLGRNVGGLHTENVRSWSSKDLASLETTNVDAAKSNQQIATEKLHELYQNLHKNELVESTEPFHADTFLRAIQEVSTIFEGNQQQDAHEFLMCVLDSIRETCQTLIKAISECPDLITNGVPEQIELTQPIKDRERETSIIKTSFFSRRSKRKDDAKQPKGLRLNSPHKESGATCNSHLDTLDGTLNVKNSRNSISTTDDDITTCEKERLKEKIKKLGLDFFTEDFEGITVSTTKCLSCETITEQKETMIDIAVPISGYESIDTSEKSQSFIQNSCVTREYFRGENKYRCEQCIGYTEAIRSISYEVLPRLLVIQLSRFSGGMEKINSYLPTPFTLQCFCAKCCEQPDSKKHHVYKLYSVITHVGATMSVGHYIAYTCSLDWANDYINCPKDRRRQANLNSLSSVNNANSNTSHYSNNSGSSNAPNVLSEKNMGLMKKMRFGRSKASSSSDMSKQVKSVNGIPNKSITNGVEKLNISTMCPSSNCCGLRVKSSSSFYNMHYNNTSGNSNASNVNNGTCTESTEDTSHPSSVFNSGNCYSDTLGYNAGSKSKTSANSQPTWYMCDDDKIKAMSQREFEDLLSPNRKIMVTPYLLFYARRDLQ